MKITHIGITLTPQSTDFAHATVRSLVRGTDAKWMTTLRDGALDGMFPKEAELVVAIEQLVQKFHADGSLARP